MSLSPLVSGGLPLDLSRVAHNAGADLTARAAVWTKLVDTGGSLLGNIGVAIIILVVTIWAARWAGKLTKAALAKLSHRKRADPTLQIFFGSLARNVVIVIGLIEVLTQLGVKTTSIIAVLGAASLAVGLALQGALANVAAGVMLLLFRPFHVGDRVQIAGKDGRVKALDLFMTELASPANEKVVVPNGKVFGEVIINFSRLSSRRVEIDFNIHQDDDIDRAFELAVACAKADTRVVDSPAPWAKLTAMNDSSVTVTLRAWVAPEDWWDARFDLLKSVKDAFQAEGLRFPYPHQVGVPPEDDLPRPKRNGVRPSAPARGH